MFDVIDVGVAYRQCRERILDLVDGIDATTWERSVPHCPAWTVRQTLAHLTGVVDDAINGNMAGVATDAWTAAQVDKRAEVPGPEIATEWATWAPFVDARATERGLALSQLLFDTVTHEHDLRYALGVPGARNSDAVIVGLAFIARNAGSRAAEHGVNLRIIVDGVEAFETPEPGATLRELALRASAFDVIRSFGSRRSLDQIRALDWSDDPASLITAVVPFGLPAAIEE